MPLLMLLSMACSGGDEEATAVLPQKPHPPGRQVSQCCSRTEATEAFGLVLEAQGQLLVGDRAALVTTLEALAPLQAELADTTAVDAFVTARDALVPCEGDACLEIFGTVADAWAGYLARSRVGEHEFALAWDARGRHHVFVQGQEPVSPYGGRRHDLSWGTQQEAEAFQQALRDYSAALGPTTPPPP